MNRRSNHPTGRCFRKAAVQPSWPTRPVLPLPLSRATPLRGVEILSSPFPDEYGSGSKGRDVQPYLYNGKEFDKMHGLRTFDYGARQYNPILPVWDRVDPLCEKYYSVSPYAYCGNNPINAIDPDGKDTYLIYWSPTENSVGHAAIAVDEYDKNGLATGCVTTYSFFPSGNEYGMKDIGSYNQGIMYINKGVSINNLMNGRFSSHETVDGSGTGTPRTPDGIIEITTSLETDETVRTEISDFINKTDGYNLATRNCADFSGKCVDIAVGSNVERKETATVSPTGTGKISFSIATPGKLYENSKKQKNVSELIGANPQPIFNHIYTIGDFLQMKKESKKNSNE